MDENIRLEVSTWLNKTTNVNFFLFRFEDGIMVPRYYLTYILSTSKAEEEKALFKIMEEPTESSS